MDGGDREATDAMKALFRSVQSNIFGKMFGEGSLTTRHVRDKFCTLAVEASNTGISDLVDEDS